jgi:hypothetical protein
MTTLTIDTLKLADKLSGAGFDRSQAEAVVRAIAEAQDELITSKDLDIALAPVKAEAMLIKWMVGFNLAMTVAILWKTFH